MIEKFPINNNPNQSEEKEKQELVVPKDILDDYKKYHLEGVKISIEEVFGQKELPKELVQEMIKIRSQISEDVDQEIFVEEISERVDEKIKKLMAEILFFKEDNKNVVSIEEVPEEGTYVIFENDKKELLDKNQEDLLQSLRMYFDSFKMVKNASVFRNNVKIAEDEIVIENQNRKLNFYSGDEKDEIIFDKIKAKYKEAGFTDHELKELLKISDCSRLAELEVHEIKTMAQIKDIFGRFLKGDTSKYVALSAALTIPAFIDGCAPMFLANAFDGDKIEMSQIAMYALLSSAAAGGDVIIGKYFKDFFKQNFKKEDGIDEHISDNLSELPSDEVNKFGTERIKSRIGGARDGYTQILEAISYGVIPASVTIGTSLAMLYNKSPKLAVGTAAGTGLMLVMDKYFYKVGKFWNKERKAESETEEMIRKMEEQLNAHMEIILSGEKEKFAEEMKELLANQNEAGHDKRFLRNIQDNFRQFYSSLNMIAASVATYFAGGTPDKFIAALAYSGRFNQSISSLLRAKARLLGSIRDIKQMDLMFNGYASEESEKEKERIGVDAIKTNDLKLENVSVVFGKKKVLDGVDLDVPQGSIVSLAGSSGAGKTTLMKVLSGYYKPSEGKVEFGGNEMDNIKKSGPDSIYSRIAYLSQFPYILEDSIKNNLLFGLQKEVDEDEIKKALSDVNLNQRFTDLNERLFSGRGDQGTTSGGESQRIGLARLLLKIRNSDSKVIFLDEPTASVDEKTRDEIADIINHEKQNRPDVTFFVISHDKEFVKKLDCRIKVKMDKGKISQNNIDDNELME